MDIRLRPTLGVRVGVEYVLVLLEFFLKFHIA